MERKLVTILIIIILVLFNFQYSYAQETTINVNNYKDEDLGIMAYKQINAFQLKLSNGSILADAGLTTDSEVTIEENMKKVKIVLVIDTSGSMRGTRCETTKNATKNLVNELFNKVGEENLNIGIIYFNTNVKDSDVLELTNNKNSISSHLDKIYASGSTYMEKALIKAEEMLNDNSASDNEIKIICTLTDGELASNDKPKSMDKFKQINEAGISTISIFVDTSIPNEFQSLANDNSLHKNFQTSTEDLASTIVNDIYNEIYMKIILMQDPVTTYNVNNAGVLDNSYGNGAIVIQVDDEIIHGATLKVEYIISVTTAFEATNLVISDLSKNLTFSENQTMLSEDKTNSDYGWKIITVNGQDYLVHRANSNISPGEPYVVKLVLSQILTTTNMGTAENRMAFSLKRVSDGKKISSPSEGIQALSILIIPPTGNNYAALYLSFVVALIVILLLIIYIRRHIKSKKGMS